MKIINEILAFLYQKRITKTSRRYVDYLRKMGVRIGENCKIYDRENIVFDLTRPWMIEIGNNVEITAKAVILTHGYDWAVTHHKYGDVFSGSGKVLIKDNVFIGIGTTILPKTVIGENTIIGSGSVVKGNIEANSVYAGIPAKKICSLDAYYEKKKSEQLGDAVELVKEYKKVYNRHPDIDVMHENFWLFENDFEKLNNTFKEKLALRGNFEICKEKFEKNTPMFSNYNEFLKYCDAQEDV